MELREQNARLAAEIAALKRRLEEKERSPKRQAAPFSSGVSITQCAIRQDAMRRNQAGVGEEYRQLRASVKDAKRGVTDDTGWRINGESASMMGFDTDEATVYKYRLRHRNQEVRKFIPSD